MGERGIFHELFSTFLLKKKDITSCLEAVEISQTFLSRIVGQLGYETTGGRADPPPLVSDVVPKPLVSEGLRKLVKISGVLQI